MHDYQQRVRSVSLNCASWLSAPAGKISATKNLPLVAKRFGSNCHPEHSRGIPLRYLKDSITGSLDCARDDRLSSENHRDSGCGPGTCARTSGQIRARADDGCVASWTSGVDSCRAVARVKSWGSCGQY